MPKHDIGELIAALNEAVNKLNNLRIKYDDLEKENARLREVLRAFPGFVDDATIGDMWIERKNAALGGEGNE
jgi:predicted nuclease with TOPRIM domain